MSNGNGELPDVVLREVDATQIEVVLSPMLTNGEEVTEALGDHAHRPRLYGRGVHVRLHDSHVELREPVHYFLFLAATTSFAWRYLKECKC